MLAITTTLCYLSVGIAFGSVINKNSNKNSFSRIIGNEDVDASAPFTNGEVEIVRGYFESNIDYSDGTAGCVIASPSSDDPNYLYHWQRDAAISMHTLQYTAPNTSTFDSRFEDYVKWVTNAQSLSDPNNIDILGEPKFNIDGSVYTGSWCRPQNDGPASRATALTGYALWCLDNDKSSFVSEYLYNDNGNGGAIPTDLNYISDHWDDDDNCDLWEEQEGIHWYTLMVQRNALIYGASLASKMNDTDVATQWNQTAASLVSTIESFESNGIISEGTRTLDCSIIVGSLYGGYDGLYGPTDSTVLNTMSEIQDFWYDAISINSDGVPGIVIGRYEDDTYTGCMSDGGSTAHGWILCTNAMGDIYYRNAQYLGLIAKNKDVKKLNKDFGDNKKLLIYSKLLKRNFPSYSKKLSEIIAKNWNVQGYYNMNEKFEIIYDLARYMTTTGDDQLTRVHYHVSGCNYHMSEQLCETNGYEIGAYDLTWSYGTFLSAWYYRSEGINKLNIKPMPREMKVDWEKVNRNIKFQQLNDNFCGGCSDQCGD